MREARHAEIATPDVVYIAPGGRHMRAIPTPDGGSVSLKVPAGSQDGRTLRVRGKGAPRLKGGRGDLLARLRVIVPAKLNKEERELVQKLARMQPDPRAGLFTAEV